MQEDQINDMRAKHAKEAEHRQDMYNEAEQYNQKTFHNNPAAANLYSNQKWLLVAVSNRKQQPASPQGPCVQVLGAFTSEDALKQHFSHEIAPRNVGLSIVKNKMGHPLAIMRSTDRQSNIKLVTDRIEAAIQNEKELFQKQREKFLARIGNKGDSNDKEQDEAKAKTEQHVKDKEVATGPEIVRGTNVGKWPRDLEMRNQNCAVMATVTPAEEEEPVVVFFGCFGTVEEAQAYIETELQRHVVTWHVDVVAMYEPIFLQHAPKTHDVQKYTYRFQGQDEVMKAPQKVQEMIKTHESQAQKELPTINLEELGQNLHRPTQERAAAIDKEENKLEVKEEIKSEQKDQTPAASARQGLGFSSDYM